MKPALLVLVVACGSSPAPTTPPAAKATQPTPGCMRERTTSTNDCTGVERPPYQTTACDRCIVDGDCTETPGGKCTTVGDNMCAGPHRFECRYPSAACGGQICSEPVITPPPAMER